MAVVVALDAGTTGVRALAIDETSTVVALTYREFTQHFPRPGWVEHDLSEIWQAIQIVISELVDRLDQPVAAIGITNQRETAAAWDTTTGEARHRAIVWQDRRTAEQCESLAAAGRLDLVRSRTGLVLDPYFTGTKFRWMIDAGLAVDDELALGTIDSWLIWKLSGGAAHVTEPSNASRTLLFDIEKLAWSEELGDLLGVPINALPTVQPSSGRFTVTAKDATAFGAGIPISGAAGDQQAALFGQACFRPGMTKNTYGTGSFVLMNIGTECPPPVDGLLTTVGWTLKEGGPATYAYEGAIFVTGAAIQWLRDGLGIIDDAADIGPLAASIADTGDVFLVPAFAGLGSPWWDPHARGTIVGLTRGTGRAELARAVVEAMAFQTRDVVDLMSRASGHPVTELRVDGGASVMPLLLQLQADQLNVPVTRPSNTETTALGAAYLAGLAEGYWGSIDEVSDAWAVDVTVTPDAARGPSDEHYQRWLKAVARSRSWADQ